jgi:hypothetical protein
MLQELMLQGLTLQELTLQASTRRREAGQPTRKVAPVRPKNFRDSLPCLEFATSAA